MEPSPSARETSWKVWQGHHHENRLTVGTGAVGEAAATAVVDQRICPMPAWTHFINMCHQRFVSQHYRKELKITPTDIWGGLEVDCPGRPVWHGKTMPQQGQLVGT